MARFRTKPVEVEAYEVPHAVTLHDVEGLRTLAAWCGGEPVNDAVDGWSILIERLDGAHKATAGDWIIRQGPDDFIAVSAADMARDFESIKD